VSDQTVLDETQQAPEETQEVTQTTAEAAPNNYVDGEQTPEEARESILAGYHKEAPTGEVTEPEPPEPKLIAGMTEDELRERLDKLSELESSTSEQLRKAFNQTGNLKQQLEGISAKLTEIASKPQTAETRKITRDSLKKLTELGFDELADALAEDLSNVYAAPPEPTEKPADPAPEKVDIDSVISQTVKARDVAVLEEVHPDRAQIVASPEFAKWFNSQTPERQRAIETGTSAAFGIRVLDEFKAWRADQAKPPTETASGSRLKNAVTPTRGGAAPQPSAKSDREALWAGYNGRKPL